MEVGLQSKKIMKKKITSVDLAKMLSISQSSVSRAFSPNSSVAKQTREKVMQMAEKVGFQPNFIARTLITGKSKIIGLAVSYMDNLFYQYVVELFSTELQKLGYHLLLFMGDSNKNLDKTIHSMLHYQIDGLIMASTSISSALYKKCKQQNIPVIFFNRYAKANNYSMVVSDNFEGGRSIAYFLAKAGYEKIAFVAGDDKSSTSQDREKGFIKGLEEQGLSIFSKEVGNYKSGPTKEAVRKILNKKIKPEVIFLANDHMALVAAEIIKHEFKLTIPDDLALVGYDNVPLANWDSFRLTSVEQPYQAMVKATVKILLEQIENEEFNEQKIILSGDLIVRESTKIPEGVFLKNNRKVWQINTIN